LIDYQLLLRLKFPGFHRVLRTVKDNSISWKKYTYEQGYSLACLIEIYIKGEIKNNPEQFDEDALDVLYSNSFGELMELLYDTESNIREIYDIDKAYIQIIDQSHARQFVKYRTRLPEINNIDEYFYAAYNRYYEDVVSMVLDPLEYIKEKYSTGILSPIIL